ncbi:hypothetical protein BU26DRAFT_562195 [Trematosphaeria pertusa]|uniref:Uncharacterized protein n=1 Tax=Trematosphaeria pertusa TaxID=390896 RepID=A0A6A6IQE0_9PLEO|nr:uncharacterized protein BU26DRAFT_562195 [Trematosphaeria pertusa]KAF2252457.1 hypothetical protein BU26DRAFT_562195 [Trematosphaeria pertusa]
MASNQQGQPAESESQPTIFKFPDQVNQYVGDREVDFNRTGILYIFRDWCWIVYNGILVPGTTQTPATYAVMGGWIRKDKVGSYLLGELLGQDWKTRSAWFQDLRAKVEAAFEWEDKLFNTGRTSERDFALFLTKKLNGITVEASQKESIAEHAGGLADDYLYRQYMNDPE